MMLSGQRTCVACFPGERGWRRLHRISRASASASASRLTLERGKRVHKEVKEHGHRTTSIRNSEPEKSRRRTEIKMKTKSHSYTTKDLANVKATPASSFAVARHHVPYHDTVTFRLLRLLFVSCVTRVKTEAPKLGTTSAPSPAPPLPRNTGRKEKGYTKPPFVPDSINLDFERYRPTKQGRACNTWGALRAERQASQSVSGTQEELKPSPKLCPGGSICRPRVSLSTGHRL